MRETYKNLTLKFFDSKWFRVPTWAEDTEFIYRIWYLKRYKYLNKKNLRRFLKDKKTIMEAGCGLARDSKFFSELNPNAKIVAVDQSPYAIKIAKDTLKGFSNCKVVKEDITTMNLKERFDFISCDQVIHHTPNPNKTLIRLFKHLNKKGIINFSVCRKKNKHRDYIDDVLMGYARKMSIDELWKFSHTVTQLGKALYDIDKNTQRFVHDNLFRCWYNPNVDFNLSVSSNYDWFSGNPRFNEKEVRKEILKNLPPYKELSFYEDKATISVSLQKL